MCMYKIWILTYLKMAFKFVKYHLKLWSLQIFEKLSHVYAWIIWYIKAGHFILLQGSLDYIWYIMPIRTYCQLSITSVLGGGGMLMLLICGGGEMTIKYLHGLCLCKSQISQMTLSAPLVAFFCNTWKLQRREVFDNDFSFAYLITLQEGDWI